MRKEIYETLRDTNLDDLIKCQSFFRRNFKNYGNYDKMKIVSSQPAKLYGTAKTHKFNIINDIISASIKL